jgi:uncharacterized repeat protein (TIGR01451 family)
MTRKSGSIVLVTLLVLLLGLNANSFAQGPAPGERSVHFLVTADLHFGAVDEDDSPTYPSYDPTTDVELQILIDEFRNSGGDIRGIVIAGDLIDSYPGEYGRPSGEEQWQHYQSIRDGYSPYFYDGWGNHDSWSGWHPDELTAEIQYDVAHRGRDAPTNRGDYHYSWDWHDVHFVQLNLFPGDSPDPSHPNIDPHGALAWLRQDLASRVGSSGRPVVIIHHYGFDCFSAGDLYNSCGHQSDWNGWWTEEQRALYWAAIADFNVVAIFTGHIHSAWNCDGDPHSGCWHIAWDRPDSVPPDVGPDEIHTFVAGDLGHGHGYALDVTIDGCNLQVERYQSSVLADDETVSFSGPDYDAPITSASIETGTPGESGWYTSTVEVELMADDGGCGEGVAQTHYMIDSGSWQTYTSPVTVSSDGSHTVRFYSQDNAENLESEQQIAVSIDATAPTGSLLINGGAAATSSALVRVEASASDASSGVYQMRLCNVGDSCTDWLPYSDRPLLWQLSPAPVSGQTYSVEAQFEDRAGNVSALVVDDILLDIYPDRPASADFRLVKSTWGAIGAVGDSASYALYDTTGQPSLIGRSSSANYVLVSGYWAGSRVNTAPLLDDSGSPALDAIDEDAGPGNGTLVSTLVARLGGSGLTDPNGGPAEGIAVVGVDDSNGTWQYTTDGGSAWSDLGAASTTAARLLAADASTRLRFVPNAHWNGTVDPGITFRAWDQFSGTNGGTADTSLAGGTSAFSSDTETASVTVDAVNDAPDFVPGGDVTVDEDSGTYSAAWATDVRPGPMEAVDEAGQVLTFTVSSHNSSLFAIQPDVDEVTGDLSFTPAADANGSTVVTVTLSDSGGTTNGGIDTSPSRTFSITVRQAADLVVGKQAEPSFVVPGQDAITYTVTVLNPGPSDVAGVSLSDALPSGLVDPAWTCIAAGTSCPSSGGSGDLAVTFDLPEGSTITYTISGTVASGATSLANTAEVDNPVYEIDWNSNTATVVATLDPVVALSISKTQTWAGDSITYTIVARNDGPSSASGAVVRDPIPAGLGGASWSCVVAGGATCGGGGSSGIDDTVDLPPGGVVTYTLTGTILGSTVVNTATLVAPSGVTDLGGGPNQTTVRYYRTRLPLAARNYAVGPDMVIDDLIASSSGVSMIIRNAGNAPTTDEFWVDVYFSPSQTPALNLPWDAIASHGVVWGVPVSIPPGGSLTLVTGEAYYFSQYSSPLPLPVGVPVFGLVDSVDVSSSYGALWEIDEGNNLYGPVVSTSSTRDTRRLD